MMTVVVPIQRSEAAADARAERVGVLLVNLGTPDSADARGVRIYLKEFLSDPRVIEDQGLLWKLVLHGIILRIRPGRKAHDYQKIWNREKNESPLKTITRAQSEKLAEAISDHDHDHVHVVVDWAMRYGNPSIRSRIDALTSQGCDRLLVVPLYPQYSAATSATVCDEVFRVLGDMRAQPTLRVTPPYYDDPDYIEALAVSINMHLANLSFQPGVRRIAVVTPGFSADCLETLEEIAQQNAEIFKHNGGEHFAAIPCLNDSDPGMDVIRQLVLRELQGWI